MGLIECISKTTKDYVNNLLEKNENRKPRYFLFGAGIMGLQVAAMIERRGAKEYFFLDNSEDKIGRKIDGHLVLSLENMMANRLESDVIIVTIQDNDTVVKQLQDVGLVWERDFFTIPQEKKEKVLKSIVVSGTSELLVLGDCSFINVSIDESFSNSLEELLLSDDRINVICYNSLYAKSYYFILKKIEAYSSFPKRIALWVDFETINHRYGMYKKVQNYELLDVVMHEYPSHDGFDAEYKAEMLEKISKAIKDVSSPNRLDTDYEHQATARKNHFKLNYLYRYREKNETEEYLGKIYEICKQYNSELTFILSPINIEGAKGLLSTEELKIIAETRNFFLNKWQGKVHVVNLTETLLQKDFIAHFSLNEGIRADGRIKIAAAIKDVINGEQVVN